MDDELKRRDTATLASIEEAYHLMVVLCTDPTQRQGYEQRLDAIREELERRETRGSVMP